MHGVSKQFMCLSPAASLTCLEGTASHPAMYLILLLLVNGASHAGSMSGNTTCEAGAPGQPARVTCHFGQDVRDAADVKTVLLHRVYNNSMEPERVVRCNRPTGKGFDCITDYDINGSVTDRLVVDINPEMEGNYSCVVAKGNQDTDQEHTESCTLKYVMDSDKKVSDTLLPETTTILPEPTTYGEVTTPEAASTVSTGIAVTTPPGSPDIPESDKAAVNDEWPIPVGVVSSILAVVLGAVVVYAVCRRSKRRRDKRKKHPDSDDDNAGTSLLEEVQIAKSPNDDKEHSQSTSLKLEQGNSTAKQQTPGTSPRQQAQGTSTRQEQTTDTSAGQQAHGASTGQQQTPGTSPGQQAHGTITGRQAQCASTGKEEGYSTEQHEEGTRQQQQTQSISSGQQIVVWYPNLRSQTYFLPQIHFNKVSYDVKPVAGQLVLVPQKASDQPGQKPAYFSPTGPLPQASTPPLASRVWPDQPVPPGLLPSVQDSDVRRDHATQQVLHYIRNMPKTEEEVMLVLSMVEFTKYQQIQTIQLQQQAYNKLKIFPGGKFDLLIISSRYGLIVGGISSVGADPSKTPDPEKAVLNAIKNAIKKLKQSETVLRYLMSDLLLVRITKTLILPNITSEKLRQALRTNRKVDQMLCACVEEPDTTKAMSRCLTASDISHVTSNHWWEKTVTSKMPNPDMNFDLYEVLVDRFCGVTVEVPSVTTRHRVVPLRTMSEAVALTGLTMAMLTLYPQQCEVDSKQKRVFLWGPPGTGKTVILVLQGLQWGRQGKNVHLVSSHGHSRAAVLLIEHQLQHSLGSTSPPTSPPLVHTHFYDFNEGIVEAAVEELVSAARDGELFVIADEAFSGQASENTTGRFDDFCAQLAKRVPDLHLWAAAVQRDCTSTCLRMEKFTTPLRCPPAVVREVSRSRLIDDEHVPKYTSSAAPFPTNGPAVRQLHHWEDRSKSTLSPGHTRSLPEFCKRCADAIAELMEELRVGQLVADPQDCDLRYLELQYRDTIILCRDPHDNLPLVASLRARGLPVQVVTSGDQAAIRDVALSVSDAVTVTNWRAISGLERRVVVVVCSGDDDADRLYAMSRCTSLLVHVDFHAPLQVGDDDSNGDDDDDDDGDDDDWH